MARWKLTEPHYMLLEEETRWEYVEVERITGRPKRTQFVVPRYLHPLDPADWNYTNRPNEDGDIIVSNGNGAQPKDLIYKGEPTPGMLPLDAEAKEISDRYAWKPTQGLDDVSQGDSFANQMLSGLFDKMSAAQTSVAQASTANIAGLSEVLGAMTKMMEQNQQILAKLVDRPTPGPMRR